MNWQTLSNYLYAVAFGGGVVTGILNGYFPWHLRDWRMQALSMGIALLVFPFVIVAILRLNQSMGTEFELTPPSRDRCFFSLSRPLGLWLVLSHWCFWIGLGELVVCWAYWPYNLMNGVVMMLAYVSITIGIKATLAMATQKSNRLTTQSGE